MCSIFACMIFEKGFEWMHHKGVPGNDSAKLEFAKAVATLYNDIMRPCQGLEHKGEEFRKVSARSLAFRL